MCMGQKVSCRNSWEWSHLRMESPYPTTSRCMKSVYPGGRIDITNGSMSIQPDGWTDAFEALSRNPFNARNVRRLVGRDGLYRY